MKSFTIYEEYYDLITLLNKREQEELSLAILQYMFEDTEPTLNENQLKIFRNLKRPLDVSKNQSLNVKKRWSKEKEKNTNDNTEKDTDIYTEQYTTEHTERDTQSKMSMSMSMSNVNVINYLNKKTNSNFKHTTEATQKLINGRFADGFTEEDFKKVIDKKVLEWTGTEFEKHLNPSTLFRPSNFEKYLNQKTTTSETPDWFDKKIEKQEVDETKRKEVEDLLKEFK